MSESTATPTPDQVQDQVTAYWNWRGRAYDEHPISQIHLGLARVTWHDALRAALPPTPAEVLDVGAGTGHITVFTAELGHRVTGIDLAEGMLAVARENARHLPNPPRFLIGDAVAPDFPPASFDAITTRYLLWTLRDPATALANWRKLLRPGGVLIAIDAVWRPEGWDNAIQSEAGVWDEYSRRYSAETRRGLPLAEQRDFAPFVQVVRDAGFHNVEVHPLTEIERLERAHAGDAAAEVQPQYLIRAIAP